MTAATVARLAADLLAAGAGFSVTANRDVVGDWVVTATPPNGTVDGATIAALETKYGITAPVTGQVVFR